VWGGGPHPLWERPLASPLSVRLGFRFCTLRQLGRPDAHFRRDRGNQRGATAIDCLREGVPAALTELRRLGRTLTQRAGDVLAYFNRPGTSNGPTEADQRTLGTPAWLRPRHRQPDQLHRQITP
jgi:hypothetical protein